MKQKFNELLDRPVTWKGYLKLAGVVSVVYAIGFAIWAIKLYWDDIKDWFKEKFTKKESEKAE